METAHPVTTTLGSYNPLVVLTMLTMWLSFEITLLKICFCWKSFSDDFFLQNFGCVFQGQTLDRPFHRSGWSDGREMKRKSISWILGWLCDLHLWPQPSPWLWIFQGQFLNSCISRIVGLIERSKSVGHWAMWTCVSPYPWPWSMFEIYLPQSVFRKVDWHGTKRMWIDHSWPWPWIVCDHGGLGWCKR